MSGAGVSRHHTVLMNHGKRVMTTCPFGSTVPRMETALWTAQAPRVSRDQSRDESHELGDDRSRRSV
jgi:hypothetical protein